MTDWQFHSTPEDDGRVRRTRLRAGTEALSWQQLLSLWQADADFRARFNRTLAEAPFAACFWETPAITRAGLTRPFEFVCVDAPSLVGIDADPHAFTGQFERHCDGDAIAEFTNLGGDARLVAPCPLQPDSCYAHLLSFVRTAPAAQRDAFWRRLGAALAHALGEAPLWLSTSGLGVYWLHARLDTRPKYYTYAPYRKVDQR